MSLRLVSSNDVIDLYTWIQNGPETVGFEALAGITGFGLTGQTNRWFEGAGDGAVYRGTRIQPRIIELPLYVRGEDRQQLMDLQSRLSLLLSPRNAPFRLELDTPDGETWYTEVVREAGGDFTRRSKDSDNRVYFRTTLTLKSGDPFWTRDRPENFVVIQDDSGRGLLPDLAKLELSRSGAFGTFDISNSGDADAKPYWTVHGPATKITLVGPEGKRLVWEEELEETEQLFIDARGSGTVVDGEGENRYDALHDAPKFWKLPPGGSKVEVALEGSSPGHYEPGAVLHRNIVPDPRATNASQWSSGWGTGGAGTKTMMTPETPKRTNLFLDPRAGSASGGWGNSAGTGGAVSRTAMSGADDGPTVDSGEKLTSYLRTTWTTASTGGSHEVYMIPPTVFTQSLPIQPPGTPYHAILWCRVSGFTGTSVRMVTVLRRQDTGATGGTVDGPLTPFVEGEWLRLEMDAVVPEGVSAPVSSIRLGVSLAAGSMSAGGTIDVVAGLYEFGTTGPFFDGDTANAGGVTNAWAGTPNASQSVQIFNDGPMLPDGTQLGTYARFTVTASNTGGTAWFGFFSAELAPEAKWSAGTTTAVLLYARVSVPLTSTRLAAQGRLNGAGVNAFVYPEIVAIAAGRWVPLSFLQTALTDFDIADPRIQVLDLLPVGTNIDVVAALVDPGAVQVINYFDGFSQNSSSGVFSWEGDENGSASLMHQAIMTGQSRVLCEWWPRRWAVI